MNSYVNWIDVSVVIVVSLLVIGLIAYIIYLKKRGEKMTGCSCESKGKAMIRYYNKQKKKEAKRQKREKNTQNKKK